MSDRDKSKPVRPSYRRIGRQLERMWDEVTKEAIPDEMMDLLRQLDEKEAHKAKAAADDKKGDNKH
jgi:hypothetical protein